MNPQREKEIIPQTGLGAEADHFLKAPMMKVWAHHKLCNTIAKAPVELAHPQVGGRQEATVIPVGQAHFQMGSRLRKIMRTQLVHHKVEDGKLIAELAHPQAQGATKEERTTLLSIWHGDASNELT